ncbi:signal peptidase II [Paracoccus sp. MBLB3053]|uniref:Lipoprotein signal peptidase n=1 Tax=Paracoccus aurantius TaxID=3073814 RepID=A0ABU2HNS1_9RHOB|nr:signal peptidase II [Paracoccus sp. MBLB3053]MDS9466683.1 signal peptidase II [Paracoccus sp. MBLB3053]
MTGTPATPKPRKSPAATRKSGARKRAPEPPVWRKVAVTAGLIFVLDQALKYLVVHVLRLDQIRELDVIDPWLNLRMAWNQGMNFGLFSSEVDLTRWILIAIALAVCLWVGVWVMRAKPSRLAQISAGFLIGGALGNVVDRMVYGAVADFLNMSLPGWRNPYSFNVADIAIFIGALGLVLQPPEKKSERDKRKVSPRPPTTPKAQKAPAKSRATSPTGDRDETSSARQVASSDQLSLDLSPTQPQTGDKPRDEGGNSR